ncbi:hypothetical protein NIM87_03410 [Devosia sp. XJ19-1]|uniref:Porin domain-containing protein n=1 Tax=Devosia ureilytica TaxID=2952754 RepID=A0A9Q4FQX5_9HYPH|nr:hypothetical protein [Devosia ureilytica]MCP8882536.1 hypothetical protein [Devosia ureilytica]MCP8885577.1 hypothetical protein [Devosia ureilytica]
MKLKSLILGSVAAAGLSTAGFAADLGVLTSLDVCDSLGISGLTISSSDNCLQITGGVTYEFNWGDYAGAAWTVDAEAGGYDIMDNDDLAGADNDWSSDVDSWLKFVGTASSDFGPASATIKIKNEHKSVVENEVQTTVPSANVVIDEAYVSVGDTTTIMAGKKGSIANFGDDEPMNFLGLFNSEGVDTGVMFDKDQPQEGGHVIQVVTTVADGVTLKAGLENLDDTVVADAGTAVGVIEYAGNGIKAHVTGLVGGILDGTVDDWAVHAGFTGTFDNFTVLGAAAYSYDVAASAAYWNVLGSAKATFDIFEIAISGEALGGDIWDEQYGVGGSIGATVTEGVKLNLGARWFDEDTSAADTETVQIAAQIVAAVSETITLTGEVGYFATNEVAATPDTDLYGSAQLAWAPGGGFTSSIKGQVHSTGAYKVTFKAAKEFK